MSVYDTPPLFWDNTGLFCKKHYKYWLIKQMKNNPNKSNEFKDAEFIGMSTSYSVNGKNILPSFLTGSAIIEQELVNRLSNSKKIGYDFWYGIISHFPLCCILFYCYVHNPCDLSNDYISKKCYMPYVECPECVIKRLENLD